VEKTRSNILFKFDPSP